MTLEINDFDNAASRLRLWPLGQEAPVQPSRPIPVVDIHSLPEEQLLSPSPRALKKVLDFLREA